jgi:serine/threonine-protein kinase
MTESLAQLTSALADRYVIERELGQGGMATVYLAHDAKHNRKVALKVLRPELAAVIGAERFLKEIEVTANLQHPHILPLFDSGEAEGFLYYVMPHVEGQTLRDRLDHEKQLPVAESVRIAGEVASALDYAHRRGVIHRDIKPENVLLHDGRAMVADFGIALAVSSAGGSRMTETGMSLGTPHYMSPEQAMGERELDARSDLYALAATLYEMLAGEPPFTGPTAQSIVAKVLSSQPEPVTTYRKTVPPHVDRALLQALQKLPADRFATASQFAATIAGGPAAESVETRSVARPTGSSPTRGALATLAGLVIVLGAVGAWGWVREAPEVSREPVRFTIDLPGGTFAPRTTSTITSQVAISPDGQTVVFVGPGQPEKQLYRRDLGTLESVPIAGTENGDTPFLSSDGRWLAFMQGNRLRKVDLVTGAAVTLTTLERSALITGASWSTQDTIYLALEAVGGLFALPGAGGSLIPVSTSDTTSLFFWPSLLPNERWLIVGLLNSADDGTASTVAAVSLETGEVRKLVDGAFFGQYLDDGLLLLMLPDGTLVTTEIDPSDPRPSDVRQPVREVIARNASQGPHLAVAQNGTVVFLSGGEALNTVVLIDKQGTETPLLTTPKEYKDPRFSPDGRRLAFEIAQGNEGDLWIYERDQATLTRVTFGSENLYPVWSPDGTRIAYTSRQSGIAGLWWKPLDGSGSEEQLLSGAELRFPGSITPDGTALFYRETAGATGFDIHSVSLTGDRTREPVLVTSFNESSPEISPDGKWLAYVSDQSGRNEVYVRRWPDGGAEWQISTDGGTEPVWDPDGRTLYFRRTPSVIAATLAMSEAALTVVRRDSLFSGQYFENVRWPEYDITPDGEQFVFIKLGDSTVRPVVVLNWVEQAKRGVNGQ